MSNRETLDAFGDGFPDIDVEDIDGADSKADETEIQARGCLPSVEFRGQVIQDRTMLSERQADVFAALEYGLSIEEIAVLADSMWDRDTAVTRSTITEIVNAGHEKLVEARDTLHEIDLEAVYGVAGEDPVPSRRLAAAQQTLDYRVEKLDSGTEVPIADVAQFEFTRPPSVTDAEKIKEMLGSRATPGTFLDMYAADGDRWYKFTVSGTAYCGTEALHFDVSTAGLTLGQQTEEPVSTESMRKIVEVIEGVVGCRVRFRTAADAEEDE